MHFTLIPMTLKISSVECGYIFVKFSNFGIWLFACWQWLYCRSASRPL